MNYLKLEICKLLQEKGCVSESNWHYYTNKNGVEALKPKFLHHVYLEGIYYGYKYPAFTWDDICTKENAIKIWGKEKTDEFGFTQKERMLEPDMPGSWGWHSYKYRYYCTLLLNLKLNGEDWEAELLKHLKD